jgi:hypothetical protein
MDGPIYNVHDMQHTLTCFPNHAATQDANPSFNVVIAYEDFETGKHAKRTYDFLVENIGRDWQFTNQMWKFDVLSLPKLRDIAVDDAARADIIMISSRGCELPEQVKSWIESWLPVASSALALVALFEHVREEPGQRNNARSYLADVARRGNLEFFAQPDDWPRRIPADSIPGAAEAARSTEKALRTLAGVVQRDVSTPRWTVNE